MRGRGALALGLVAALVALPACEKETHRSARRAFQDLMARNLPPAEQAAALEEFVRLYPEPKTNPNLERAFGLLADYHARSGRPDIAASWYERAVRVSPDDPDLLNALGFHYARHRMNLDRAVSVLEDAVRLAEERGYPERRQGLIKDSLGWAYRMRGDLPLAVALLEEATRLAPGVAVIQEHLAECYHAIGERDKAASLYLDLYLRRRGTSRPLRDILLALGREGGPAYAREVDRRIADGLKDIVEKDRRETEAQGARLVQVVSRDGQRLSGSLYGAVPDGARGGRAPAVLIVHPLGSSRAAAAAIAATLAARGFQALALDLRGHGGSVSETLPDAHTFSANLAANLRAAEEDVRSALAFLARQPGVDGGRLGIVGAGLGALLAARAALADRPAPRPSALVLLSPWGRAEAYRDGLSRLPPEALLVVAGSGEESAAGTARALAPEGGRGVPKCLIVDRPGAHFALAESDPGLLESLAGFLESGLADTADAAARGGRP